MGAAFYFDETVHGEFDIGHAKTARRIEIFTHGGNVYRRIGPAPSDEGHYALDETSITLQLPKDQFLRFHDGITGAGTSQSFLA